ncbi:MAG: hypothetical protein AAF899_18315, partial [Pseudomonadota bacterium]
HLVVDDAAGWLAYGALDGAVRAIDLLTGETIADLSTERRPILALVRAPGGRFLATGDGEGYITVIDSERWTIERDFRAALRGPIWALAWARTPPVDRGGSLPAGSRTKRRCGRSSETAKRAQRSSPAARAPSIPTPPR